MNERVALYGCPQCHGALVNWSEPSYGSFGNACLNCKLFVWQEEGVVSAKPLDLAVFPRAYNRIPAYRDAVGWR